MMITRQDRMNRAYREAKKYLPHNAYITTIRYIKDNKRTEVQYRIDGTYYKTMLNLSALFRPVAGDVYIFGQHTGIKGIEAVGAICS